MTDPDVAAHAADRLAGLVEEDPDRPPSLFDEAP